MIHKNSSLAAVRRLGVNVDHVATLREARHTTYPDPVTAALEAEAAGADVITVHLREDRRHIKERDLWKLKRELKIGINLEMALAQDIVETALRLKPESVCIVPERRQELTTEGGLDVFRYRERLKKIIPRFKARHIAVSLFIEPDKRQLRASHDVGANYVELHTGKYVNARNQATQRRELLRIIQAVRLASSLGLRVNAGHGLHYQNVQAIARIPEIEDLNIGHSIVGKAVILGMKDAVAQMKKAGALLPSRRRPRSSKRKIS